MHIICPHCTTSYAIDLATLGAAGRTVRCSRCKEVWLARPEDAIDAGAPVPAMAEAGDRASAQAAAAQWDAQVERGRQPGTGNPGRRQPFDIGRLAGFGRRRTPQAPAPTGRDGPERSGGRSGGRRSGASAAAVMVPEALEAAGAGLRQIIRQPSDRLRRHGRAGAGADDLARRRGAAAAADRDVLQNGRSRRQRARACVQGHQDHHRDRGRQTGAGDRGRHRRRSHASRSSCRGCASASATPRAPRSTPGTRYWTSRC